MYSAASSPKSRSDYAWHRRCVLQTAECKRRWAFLQLHILLNVGAWMPSGGRVLQFPRDASLLVNGHISSAYRETEIYAESLEVVEPVWATLYSTAAELAVNCTVIYSVLTHTQGGHFILNQNANWLKLFLCTSRALSSVSIVSTVLVDSHLSNFATFNTCHKVTLHLMLYGYGCVKKAFIYFYKCLIFAENVSAIFLGDQEQDENEGQEFVWCLYRQFYRGPRASQGHLESKLINAVSCTCFGIVHC